MYRAKRGQKKKRKVICQKTKMQIGSFSNRYDFKYAGRYTVNQASKVAPNIIKGATNKINNITNKEFIKSFHREAKKLNEFFPIYLEELQRAFIKHHSDYCRTLEKTIGQIKKQNFNIDVILFYFVYNHTIIIKIYITENVNWHHYSH